jgi:hypothetical protein
MADTFNAHTSADALARDLGELRDRLTNDKNTQIMTVLAGVGAVATVVALITVLIRKRRLIRNVLLVANVAATVWQLRARLGLTDNDGPPPPPPAPGV